MGNDNEYTTVREIRTIWEKRTPENQVTIMRFIRQTVHNVRRFVRQTRVWGEELSEMWTEAVDVLADMGQKSTILPPSPGAVVGASTRV